MKCRVNLLGFLWLAATSTVAAANDPWDGQWRYSLTPYFWLPAIKGDLRFDLPSPGTRVNASLGPDDYLSNLDFAVMLSGEARKGNVAIVSDLIYLDFGNAKSELRSVEGPLGHVELPVDTGTRTDLKAMVWSIAGSYTVARTQRASLDIIAGTRYVGLDVQLDWRVAGTGGLLPGASGSVERDIDLWDGIVGVRGRIDLDAHWFVRYYVDIGTGDTKLSWQAMTGVGYRFGWGDLLLAWRHLAFEQDSDKLVRDLKFGGVTFAASFRW